MSLVSPVGVLSLSGTRSEVEIQSYLQCSLLRLWFRGGLREHGLEMLISISDNVLTCLLPYLSALGSWSGMPGRISVIEGGETFCLWKSSLWVRNAEGKILF